MFNRLSTARAGLAALSLAAASLAFAQPEAPLQLALATQSEAVAQLDLQADAAQPLAVMLDQPTGGRFVYRAGRAGPTPAARPTRSRLRWPRPASRSACSSTRPAVLSSITWSIRAGCSPAVWTPPGAEPFRRALRRAQSRARSSAAGVEMEVELGAELGVSGASSAPSASFVNKA